MSSTRRRHSLLSAKAPHAKRQDRATYQTTAKLLEASVAQRAVSTRYHSQESRREKDYVVHRTGWFTHRAACT